MTNQILAMRNELRKEVNSFHDFYFRVSASIYHTLKQYKEAPSEKLLTAIEYFKNMIGISDYGDLNYKVQQEFQNLISSYLFTNKQLNEDNFGSEVRAIYTLYYNN